MDATRIFNMVKLLIHFISMMRYRNLFIIAFTMFSMRYFVIEPILWLGGYTLQFSTFHFFLLVISTLCIAAGGNIINDYFDVRTDLINKPQRVVVGKYIDRKAAILWHFLFSLLGIALAFYVSMQINRISFSMGFVLIVGLLWLYSTEYKKWLLVGNLIVAFLTALVPFLVLVYEIPSLNLVYWESLIRQESNFSLLVFAVTAFSVFGFVTNLMREIIKDIEDLEGDNAYGCRTLPIVFGVTISKIVVSFLNVLLFGSILFLLFFFLSRLFTDLVNLLSVSYVLFFILIPLFVVQLSVIFAKQVKHYRYIHSLIKWLMFFGLLYTLVFRFLMQAHLS